MEQTLRELFDKEIAIYEADFLQPEEKENTEEILKDSYNKLFYTLDFDNRVDLIKLKNCYDQLVSQKQKNAFIKGFSLAMTYMMKKNN